MWEMYGPWILLLPFDSPFGPTWKHVGQPSQVVNQSQPCFQIPLWTEDFKSAPGEHQLWGWISSLHLCKWHSPECICFHRQAQHRWPLNLLPQRCVNSKAVCHNLGGKSPSSPPHQGSILVSLKDSVSRKLQVGLDMCFQQMEQKEHENMSRCHHNFLKFQSFQIACWGWGLDGLILDVLFRSIFVYRKQGLFGSLLTISAFLKFIWVVQFSPSCFCLLLQEFPDMIRRLRL